MLFLGDLYGQAPIRNFLKKTLEYGIIQPEFGVSVRRCMRKLADNIGSLFSKWTGFPVMSKISFDAQQHGLTYRHYIQEMEHNFPSNLLRMQVILKVESKELQIHVPLGLSDVSLRRGSV